MSFDSIFRPGLFAGQTIIVTGGGSGIGRCTAHELAHLGATVVLVGRTADKLAKVAAEIADVGGTARTFTCDIREEAQVREVVQQVLAAQGRIDGLVNNAGGQFAAPLATISQRGWDAVVRNNLTGGFLFARECYTQWMSDHGGAIVNMVADFFGSMVGMGHSGAARAGMVSFTETAAVEWGQSGVRVNAIAPAVVATAMTTATRENPERLARFMQRTPLGRVAEPEELVGPVVFLASDMASYVTGVTLPVDGGYLAV